MQVMGVASEEVIGVVGVSVYKGLFARVFVFYRLVSIIINIYASGPSLD